MSKEGRDFGEALQRAQSLGYAEADPTNDVEGIDAAYKLSILSSLAFRTTVTPDEVYREGITKLSARTSATLARWGTRSALAVGKKEDGAVQVRVHPVLLAETEPWRWSTASSTLSRSKVTLSRG
jgi:homoserine dehydrogenase